MPTKSKEETNSAEFLIAEFNALHSRVLALEQVKANRINYFLLLTSALVAGGASLYDPLTVAPHFWLILVVVSLLLAVLGFITLDYSVNDSVTIVYFLRAAGRVRRYFVDKDKKLTPYIAFEPNDDRPRIRSEGFSFRGSERILLIINCVSLSACVTSSVFQFLPIWATLLIAVSMLLIVWIIQQLYIKRKLINAEKGTSSIIRFKS
jgi:hypothetical protein